MPRMPRIQINNALYYVTSRGDHNEDIFLNPADYQAYISLLKKYKTRLGFELYAYCLMPNHLHLLIELKHGTTISEIMHRLNSNYTKYFNARYHKKGHLFRERYRMVLLEKDHYLLPLISYIHRNPQQSRITENLEQYVYSSHRDYLGLNKNGHNLVLEDEIRQVGRLVRQLAYRDYFDFFSKINAEEMQLFAEELNKKLILGSDDFLAQVKQKVKEAEDARDQEHLPPTEAKESILQPKVLIYSGLVLVALVVVAGFMFYRHQRLQELLKTKLLNSEKEYAQKLETAKKEVKKDLDEMYRADMVSYQAMAKRLEIEKQKNLLGAK